MPLKPKNHFGLLQIQFLNLKQVKSKQKDNSIMISLIQLNCFSENAFFCLFFFIECRIAGLSNSHAYVSKLLSCEEKPHSACKNHTLRIEINRVRVEITLVRVEITLVRVEISLCVYESHSYV
jgi:hypothetical protein